MYYKREQTNVQTSNPTKYMFMAIIYNIYILIYVFGLNKESKYAQFKIKVHLILFLIQQWVLYNIYK